MPSDVTTFSNKSRAARHDVSLLFLFSQMHWQFMAMKLTIAKLVLRSKEFLIAPTARHVTGVLASSSAIFSWLISRCVGVKRVIVLRDFKEKGQEAMIKTYITKREARPVEERTHCS